MPPNPPSNSRLPRLAVWSGYGTALVLKVYHNYMYNKILKYEWLSSVLISALMTVFFIFWNETLLWNYTISLLRDQDTDFSFVLFSWCNKDLIIRINLFCACSPYILLRSITISSQPTSPSEQRILNDVLKRKLSREAYLICKQTDPAGYFWLLVGALSIQLV